MGIYINIIKKKEEEETASNPSLDMESETIRILEQVADSCLAIKLCGACGQAYRDLDNLTLPCSTHPGEPLGDIGEPFLRVWSCCAETTLYGERSYPCTKSAHSQGLSPLPTVIVIRGEIPDPVSFEQSYTASEAVVVRSAADLERAERVHGRERVAGLPCYNAILDYVSAVGRGTDACSYYFPDGEEDYGHGADAQRPEAPRRSLCIVLARSRAPGSSSLDMPGRLKRLAASSRMHVVRLIARYSPNPHTAAVARDMSRSTVVAY